jgi:two-component system sensor histidine kinase UhpB
MTVSIPQEPHSVDLRRRLVVYLGALIFCLLLVSAAVVFHAVRDDAAAEVRASEHLARVMLAAGELGYGHEPAVARKRLEAVLAEGPLRHLQVSLADVAAPVTPDAEGAAGWLASWLGVMPPGEAYRINFPNANLLITPNPASEIDEILHDAARLFITLLLFSGATLLVAWRAAHHALAPVRRLEEGLDRLADGEPQANLPAFELREFSRVAKAINHLAGSLEEARHGQRQLAQELITVQEAERRQLAAELHDEMGQMLTAISVTAAYLERHGMDIAPGDVVLYGRELKQDVRIVGEQLRGILKRLRPHGLDGFGLKEALHDLLDGWQQREAAIHFDLHLPANLPPVRAEVGLVLYRVVQEALTNVVRHSQASDCRVALTKTSADPLNNRVAALDLVIADNGCGRSADVAKRMGAGLLGMRERLAMVGGSLALADLDPQGLQIVISIPEDAGAEENRESRA